MNSEGTITKEDKSSETETVDTEDTEDDYDVTGDTSEDEVISGQEKGIVSSLILTLDLDMEDDDEDEFFSKEEEEILFVGGPEKRRRRTLREKSELKRSQTLSPRFSQFKDQKMVPVEQYEDLLEKYRELQEDYNRLMDVVKEYDSNHAAKKLVVKNKNHDRIKRRQSSLRDSSALLLERKSQHKKISQMKNDRRKEQSEARKSKVKDRRKLQRLNVLEEIITTEKSYLEGLQILIRARFVLVEAQIITDEEANQIFSNIDELYNLHVDITKALDSRMLSTPDEDCWKLSVGDLFLKLEENLSNTYATYINNQSECTIIVEKLSKERKFFKYALYQGVTEFDDEANVIVNLHSFLITPIQRMCKYPLLLKELIKYTDENHDDDNTLKLALTKIGIAARDVNERKKSFENYIKMLELYQSLENLPASFKSKLRTRVFIREGELGKISKGKLQDRKFFLFDDMLMYGCRGVLKTGKLAIRGRIMLDRVLINDLPDTDSLKHSFELVRVDHKKKKYIMCAGNSQTKEIWMKDISERVNFFLRQNQKLRSFQRESQKLKLGNESSFSPQNTNESDILTLLTKVELLKDENRFLSGDFKTANETMIVVFEAEIERLRKTT